jgi:excisionase family DNA binding protein
VSAGPQMLTAEDVADRLQLSYSSVVKAARAGRLPAVKILGCWRIDPRRLDDWIASQEPRKQEDFRDKVRRLRSV